jgi:hypothetical protein
MRFTLALPLAFILGACAGSAKREAATLIGAVDRYRRADNASRAGLTRSIEDVACTDAQVCDAKRACLAAIDPTTRALRLKDEVTLRLADIEGRRLAPDASEAQALPDKLDEAARLLSEGRAKMPDCEKKLTDLRLEHGV